MPIRVLALRSKFQHATMAAACRKEIRVHNLVKFFSIALRTVQMKGLDAPTTTR